MLSRIRDRNIWIVYAAALLLGVAYGIAVALLALHLDALGFGKQAIGSLAVCFAFGIVALSLPAGWLVRRFSARVTLAVALAGYAVSVAVFPVLRSYGAIAAARFCDGAFSVCVWVSCETILLRRAPEEDKANVTSVYAMAIAIGYVLGPLAAKVVTAAASMQAGFIASGVIAAAACATAARLDRDDRAEVIALDAAKTPATAILARIKTSCFATFAYGYFQASVVLFLPLYLIESKGVAKESTILIPAFFAAGMLLFSNVCGKFADRHGHLVVMRALAGCGTLMVLGFVWLASFPLMCGAVFIAGATLASISPVSLALQGLVVDGPDLSRANAIYNAFYAAGILLGPLASSALFARWGGGAMLFHLAALWTAFVGFAIAFAADDPAARRARRAGVVAVPGAPDGAE